MLCVRITVVPPLRPTWRPVATRPTPAILFGCRGRPLRGSMREGCQSARRCYVTTAGEKTRLRAEELAKAGAAGQLRNQPHPIASVSASPKDLPAAGPKILTEQH